MRVESRGRPRSAKRGSRDGVCTARTHRSGVSMRIRDTFEEGVQILHVVGDFGVDEAESLYAHVDHAIDLHRVRVVLDVADVGEVTSGGLVAVLRARKRLQERGGGLAIAHPPKSVFAAFQTVGLDRCVTCFDSVQEAVSHFDDAVARTTTLLGEIAMRPRCVTLEFVFTGPGQSAVAGVRPYAADLTAVNALGVEFHPRDPSLLADRPWLFAHDVPLRLSFHLRADHTEYPVCTAASVVSCGESAADPLAVLARFTHLLVADRVVIEMYMHHGHDQSDELLGTA